MTITIDIRPEDYATSLLEEAAHLPAGERKPEGGKSLVEVCAMVRDLTDDVDFSRNPSTGRPVNL
jgi:hypothetical protein